MEQLKRTPLYEWHIAAGGKMVPFAGWEMPVQYGTGIIDEHQTVRTKAGLFDVSHMGEIIVRGPEATEAINYLTCNDVRAIGDYQAQYNAITNKQGGLVDDIIVYRYKPDYYLICVNAANTDKDFAWFTEHNQHKATFENKSDRYGQIAIQGPAACGIVEKYLDHEVGRLKTFHFKDISAHGYELIVARTGYTGEDGFEVFVKWADTRAVWEALYEAGKEQGLKPIGLGARDSLRLEACYPLHGHEAGDDVSAIESGLGWIVKPEKGDFIGREVLAAQKQEGSPRALAAFVVREPGIVRHGDKLFAESGEEAGITTSGTKTPTINQALGLALVKTAASNAGTTLFAEVRGRRIRCEVVKKPFYKKPAVAPC